MNFQKFLLVIFLSVSCQEKTELKEAEETKPTSGSGNTNAENDSSAIGISGAKLYNDHCIQCHGPLERSTKKGATFKRIKLGLELDSMEYLQSEINDLDIVSIAKALEGSGSSTDAVFNNDNTNDNNTNNDNTNNDNTNNDNTNDNTNDDDTNNDNTNDNTNDDSTNNDNTNNDNTNNDNTNNDNTNNDNTNNDNTNNDNTNNDNTNDNTNDDNTTEISGLQLYRSHCKECHKKIANSAKKGATVNRIKAGLELDPMKFLKSELSEEEIEAIAKLLSSE